MMDGIQECGVHLSVDIVEGEKTKGEEQVAAVILGAVNANMQANYGPIEIHIKGAMMRELSLFSGAGGGLLATKYLLGWTTIGMVEYDSYCQKVLRQRQEDGYLERCPIFGDIRDFVKSGTAKLYREITDVITAGFPCQPFSVAGKRAGEDDPRNMWPETRETIRCVRPRYAFLENVPGLLTSGYFFRILSDLYEIGYDARWTVLGADNCGAWHRRKRLWILAHPKGLDVSWGSKEEKRRQLQRCKKPRRCYWREAPPPFLRMDDGVDFGMDRLKAIGNGQVPQCTALAWKILSEEYNG